MIGVVLVVRFHQVVGYSIPGSEALTENTEKGVPEVLQAEDVDSQDGGDRIKRQSYDYESDVVYSPYYGYGYYIFPRAFPDDDIRREYKPLVRYHSSKTHKRKKLFVPNLFG